MDQHRRSHLLQDRMGLARAQGIVGRDTDIERPTRPDDVVECAAGLLQRGFRIEPVRIEDVDIIETEPLEALVA
jgi:hypothetical protein